MRIAPLALMYWFSPCS